MIGFPNYRGKDVSPTLEWVDRLNRNDALVSAGISRCRNANIDISAQPIQTRKQTLHSHRVSSFSCVFFRGIVCDKITVFTVYKKGRVSLPSVELCERFS